MNYQELQSRKAEIDNIIATNNMPMMKAQLDAFEAWRDNRTSYNVSEIPPELAHINNDFREAVYMWQWQNGQFKPEEITVYQSDKTWLYSWTGYPIGEIGDEIPDSWEQKDYDVDENELDEGVAFGCGVATKSYKATLNPTISHPYTRYVMVKIAERECIAYKDDNGNVDYEWEDSDMDLCDIEEYGFTPIIEKTHTGKFWRELWREFLALENPDYDDAHSLFCDKFSDEEWELFEDELEDMYRDNFEDLESQYVSFMNNTED